MKKIMMIAILASTTTFSLFTFMAFLISSDNIEIIMPLEVVRVDVIQTPEDSKVEVKPKMKFVPPTPPPVMPRNNVSIETAVVDTTFNYQPTGLTISDESPGIKLFSGTRDRDARPVVRVNPKYPMDASREGIEGWVVLAFDINEIGGVINIRIVESFPKRIFDRSARQALKKWKYQPKSVEGKKIAQQGFTVQLDFKMSQAI